MLLLAFAAALTITVSGGDFGDRSYTLSCDPANGTVPHPSAACATLKRKPELLKPQPGTDHSCPPGTPSYKIDGTYAGAAVDASFSDCVSGQGEGVAGWWSILRPELPVLHGRPTLKVDSGVGPLRLGARSDSVEPPGHGRLLPDSRVAYTLAKHGGIATSYGSTGRIERIEAFMKVDLGRVQFKRWQTFSCRPGRVYVHHHAGKWTALEVTRGAKRVWGAVLGTGAAPKTCDELSLAN